MKPPKEFQRWWKEAGLDFAHKLGAKDACQIAWSNGAYLARGSTTPIDYRRMKKAPPDRPGMWAYRVPGATESVNVAVTRGSHDLFLHHPNGSIYIVWRWSELYPKIRWKKNRMNLCSYCRKPLGNRIVIMKSRSVGKSWDRVSEQAFCSKMCAELASRRKTLKP